MKVLKNNDQQAKMLLLNEAHYLKQLKHQHIIDLVDAQESAN